MAKKRAGFMGRLISLPESLSLDSNIFIAVNDKQNDFHKLAQNILIELDVIRPKVFISILVFEEFLVRFYQKKADKSLTHFENFLTGGGLYKVVEVNRPVARKAAQIRAKFPKIKTPDAIHLASAIEAGVEVFITTDRGLPVRIEKLRIVNLNDLDIG